MSISIYNSTIETTNAVMQQNASNVITVILRDESGNIITTANDSDFTFIIEGGTAGKFNCINGVCTTEITTDTEIPTVNDVLIVSAKINDIHILLSPIVIKVI